MSTPLLISAQEFLKRPRRTPQFGGWSLDRRTLCLVLRDVNGDDLYEIDLERCRTSAQLLDWVMQVAGKLWATDAVLAGLVRALDAYLDPQTRLCSFGMERGPIDVRTLLRRRAGR